jgi:hypothetical protein
MLENQAQLAEQKWHQDVRFQTIRTTIWRGKLLIHGSVETTEDLNALKTALSEVGLPDANVKVMVGKSIEERLQSSQSR